MKKDFRTQMSMLTEQYQERFYKEQREEWDIPFTSTAINEHFSRYRRFGLTYETPVGLNVSPEYFTSLMFNTRESFTVADIVTLCQSFERRTFFEYMQMFGLKEESQQGYADFLSCMEQLTTEVNAIVEPIKDKLIRKMIKLQSLGHGSKTIAMS